MKRITVAFAFASLLLAGLPAHAVDYVIPGYLPPGVNCNNLVCSAISIGGTDSITLGSGYRVNGSITTTDGFITLGDNVVIDSSLTTDNGNILVGNATLITGSITTSVTGNIMLGNGVEVVGDAKTKLGNVVFGKQVKVASITAVTGNITVGVQGTVSGGVTATTGSITFGEQGHIGGGITSSQGHVTLGPTAWVYGAITATDGDVSFGDFGRICGAITATNGFIKVGNSAWLGAAATATAGYIVLGHKTQVAGAIYTTNAPITMGDDVQVVGAITSTSGNITYGDRLGHAAAITTGGTVFAGKDAYSGVTVNAACTAAPPFTPIATASTTASTFACLESGIHLTGWNAAASTHKLYTKLVGTAFAFDVVALKTDGTVETNYVASGEVAKNITLELVDGAGSTACDSRSVVSPAQSLSFAAADAGRKAVSLTLNQAHPNLRCRVTDAAAVKACSSDNFAVRPSGLVVTSSANADGNGSSASALPANKTDANFTLSANSSAVGYNTAPKLDLSKVVAHPGAVRTGTLAGNFGSAIPVTGIATGIGFSYSEVGYFRLLAQGAYDEDFAQIDASQGDCTPDFSNNLVGGQYGCKFGNVAPSTYVGRFYPDHVAVSAPALTPGCGTSFTYFGQDGLTTRMTLTAENATNTTTQNYTGDFARLDPTQYANYGFSAATLPSGLVLSSGASAPSGAWAKGVAEITARHQINRSATPTEELTLTLSAAPIDPDLQTGTAGVLGSAKMRYGRLKLSNAYGSEKQDLKLPVTLQYWTALGWQTNTLDVCSMSQLSSSNFAFEFSPLTVKNTLTACDTVLQPIVSTASALTLSKPISAHVGWAEVSLNLSAASGTQCSAPGGSGPAAMTVNMPWLQYGSSGPKARATFGLFKSPLIYRRENY